MHRRVLLVASASVWLPLVAIATVALGAFCIGPVFLIGGGWAWVILLAVMGVTVYMWAPLVISSLSAWAVLRKLRPYR